MALSNDLISQFVKATKDKQDAKKETVVYGTIDRNDTDKVIIDGSNISTPVTKTVIAGVTTKEDGTEEPDRVMVTIKNHTAMVTGNLSNPSARNGDTLKVLELEATNAKIEDLETLNAEVQGTLTATNAEIKDLKAIDADIQGTLTAHDGKIKNLEAADAEITGRLTAAEADIDYLQALDIDVEKLNAAYAFVEDLEANHADVDYLVSTVADIDELIFGSASGDVIQTSFSNAVIAQLGDAQIKSAMIENVSASQITAGDIITNNVRVMSEDGSLIISDEMIQIKDGNEVRVQIGKDASGDYSIVICDPDGNVMFHEGGIKEAAIKEAIIRNDMVSDTANIHASKLDIDSLFEEINDSSNTIKSTKVYLDEQGQSLDVAFKSLTTEVSDQGETISSQGTAISTIQGQISSKIWQQDINTAKNEMSTQYSTLEQNLNGFKTTVNSTTNTLGARMTTMEQTAEGLSVEIGNLEIGGRNYFRPSQTVDLGCTGALDSATLINTGSCVSFYVPTVAGDVWSISRSSIENTNRFDYGFTIDKPAYGVRIYGWNSVYRDKTKIEGIVIPEGYNYLFVYLSNQKDDASSVKVERGNKATDWTPAPEDVESDILNASKTATNYMNFSSGGLVIGDLTASSLGKNVLIDSSSVKIRTGNTINAKFGADIIELAKDNESATISMLNGTFKIYYSADTSEAGLGIYGITSDGEERLAFQPVNENDNLTIGWGGYNAGKNSTNIYGYNMKLIAGNDMSIENDHWKVNIDGNLFAKASTDSFVELIGLSSDNNTAIGHGGYTSSLGKTNIYGNKINHIVNTTRGSATYKPYYEAGDSVEIEWYGAGFVSSSSKVVYFTIPLAKPIIGGTTPNVSISSHSTDGGLRIRQDGNYVFGSASDTHVTPSSYKAQVSGEGNIVRIEATMSNTTNAVNNAPCGVDARIKLTFS